MIPWPVNPVERFEAMLAQGKDNALLRFTLGSHYLKEGDAARRAPPPRGRRPRCGVLAAWKLLGKALAAQGRSARGDRGVPHRHRRRGTRATSRRPRR
jgi:hypothetical protein